MGKLQPGLISLCVAIGSTLLVHSSKALDEHDTALAAVGIDVSGFDQSVRPQDDFHRFVNGRWIAQTDIPQDKQRYGPFVILREQVALQLKELIEGLANDASLSEDSDKRKIGDFYASYMDRARVGELGLAPLAAQFAEINEIKTRADIVRYFAHAHRIGAASPLSAVVFGDFQDQSQYITYVGQAGLSLPGRKYYFSDVEALSAVRDQLPAYMERLLTLAGYPDSQNAAQAAYDLELKLAEIHWPAETATKISKVYNRFALAALDTKLTADFPWRDYFRAIGVAEIEDVVVAHPSYVVDLAALIDDVPLDQWRAYFTYGLLNSLADYLPSAFGEAKFEFYGKRVEGIKEQAPRWRRAVDLMNQQETLGWAVARVYSENYFSQEIRKKVEALVGNILIAYEESVDELSWMGEGTKLEAKDKLRKMTSKIGSSRKWREFSSLVIDRTDLVGNVIRIKEFQHDYLVAKLGRPADKEEWSELPQSATAIYDPTKNAIILPAAFLQPPFFSVTADRAVNYGAVGGIIAHEISHGFGVEMSRLDGDGNIRDWWTEEDREAFLSLGDRLKRQYDQYTPLDGINVNGSLTLGENISDLSGVRIAYRAYKASLKGRTSETIGTLTGEQRFFIGWAQMWRIKLTEEAMVKLVTTGSHSPPKYRVNGVMTNLGPFYEAWEVAPGDGMYTPRRERTTIW